MQSNLILLNPKPNLNCNVEKQNVWCKNNLEKQKKMKNLKGTFNQVTSNTQVPKQFGVENYWIDLKWNWNWTLTLIQSLTIEKKNNL